jgi:virginiamycin B lyase
MTRLGIMLAALVAISTASGMAHAKMAMQTFPVLAGAGPHDVYPTPDGTVWFTAQSSGKLGRLDPRNGKSDFIALGPGAAPHAVIVAPMALLGSPKVGRTRSPGLIRRPVR